jgi:hypothetical protein
MRFILGFPLLAFLPFSVMALNLSIEDGDGQTADPGSAVAVPPSVLVTNEEGVPVAGETVTFSIYSGGGLISGAIQPTNSQGVAQVGSWVLGHQPGPMKLQAETDDSSSILITAHAVGETDLRVDLDADTTIVAGDPFFYALTISNEGPYTADGILVSMTFDSLIETESISWTCDAWGAGSDCASSGSGSLMDSVDLPPSGEVVYTVSAAVPINLTSGHITSSADITPPEWIMLTDPGSGTDSASSDISANPKPIFSDRFSTSTP